MAKSSSFSPKKLILPLFVALIFIFSLALGLHNASLYQPDHGFDGSGHIYYIEFIAKHGQIPPPTEWETHQPPLYYILAASILNLTQNIKSIQYINIFIHWLIVCIVGLGIKKVLKDKKLVLLGMLSLLALPMLNIFPPMVTNELLSTLFIISSIVASIFLQYAHTIKQFFWICLWITASLVLGVWTKISVITIMPIILIAFFLIRKTFPIKVILITLFTIICLFSLAYLPIFLRAENSQSPSDIVGTVSALKKPLAFDFYFRLDWIPKVDMYNTQYYSLLGGGWNSFWTDGHNAITPFVPFHKKAFVLWALGFVLFPISLFGLYKMLRKNKQPAIIVWATGISMFALFVLINTASNHYSAVRLTYEMAIVIPYAFGIASASKYGVLRYVIPFLLLIQFFMMISFYWIQPWWFQAT